MALAKEPTKWSFALGESADITTVPDSSSSDTGSATKAKLFPKSTSLSLSAGGIPPAREDFNALFKELGSYAWYQQHGGIPTWNMNFDYSAGSLVKYNDNVYQCIKDALLEEVPQAVNPTNAQYWSKVATAADLKNFDGGSGGTTTVTATDTETGPGFKKALCWYGYPSDIQNLYEPDLCAAEYSKYDLVIFGDEYEDPKHEDYANFQKILGLMKSSVKTAGYVPIGCIGSTTDEESRSNFTIAELKVFIDQWKTLGVKGIFLDEFGYDYKVTRERQNELVDYCHNNNLFVVANAWFIEDVFDSDNTRTGGEEYPDFLGNPNGLDAHLNENDIYFFENLFSEATSKKKFTISTSYRVQQVTEYYSKYWSIFKTQTMSGDNIPENADAATKAELKTLIEMGAAIMGMHYCLISGYSWNAEGNNTTYDLNVPFIGQHAADTTTIHVDSEDLESRPIGWYVTSKGNKYTLNYKVDDEDDTVYKNTKQYIDCDGYKVSDYNFSDIELDNRVTTNTTNVATNAANITQLQNSVVTLNDNQIITAQKQFWCTDSLPFNIHTDANYTREDANESGHDDVYRIQFFDNADTRVGYLNVTKPLQDNTRTMDVGLYNGTADMSLHYELKNEASTGTITANNCSAFYCNEFYSTSDERLKDNLENVHYDLSSLGTYKYNFKPDNGKVHVGLLAQEVQKVIPEAVSENKDGYLTVDYNSVVAALVSEVNELKKRVQELENQ